MNQTELRWTSVNQSEPVWTKMNQNEPKWIKMNQSEQTWTNSNYVFENFGYQIAPCKDWNNRVEKWKKTLMWWARRSFEIKGQVGSNELHRFHTSSCGKQASSFWTLLACSSQQHSINICNVTLLPIPLQPLEPIRFMTLSG